MGPGQVVGGCVLSGPPCSCQHSLPVAERHRTVKAQQALCLSAWLAGQVQLDSTKYTSEP